MEDIRLADIETGQLGKLRSWLQAEHVRPWFPNAEEAFEWAHSVPENGRQRFITEGDRPVGYIRWTYVSRAVLDSIGFQDIPANSADLDLLIGSKRDIGRGIGGQALELVVQELRAERIAPLAALTTSVDNHSAHKAFARAGFRTDRKYSPEGFGRCFLMLRKL